jgi:hypothetical protein
VQASELSIECSWLPAAWKDPPPKKKQTVKKPLVDMRINKATIERNFLIQTFERGFLTATDKKFNFYLYGQ